MAGMHTFVLGGATPPGSAAQWTKVPLGLSRLHRPAQP